VENIAIHLPRNILSENGGGTKERGFSAKGSVLGGEANPADRRIRVQVEKEYQRAVKRELCFVGWGRRRG